MDKIIIIGCPGSGKSTFAKELKKHLDLPLYHLDLIWNKEDKTTTPPLKIKSATSPTPAVIVAGSLTINLINITKNPSYGP